MLYKPILTSTNLNYYSHFKIFNFLIEDPFLWNITKSIFIISLIISIFIILNFLYSIFRTNRIADTKKEKVPTFGLLVGNDENKNKVYISEKGLYQNILVTGTIGSGKTSSALYPFTKQLISYNFDNDKKLSFLILDVKGNYYSKVIEFARAFSRLDDVIVIELRRKLYI